HVWPSAVNCSSIVRAFWIKNKRLEKLSDAALGYQVRSKNRIMGLRERLRVKLLALSFPL
ncbi:MAG: hypothetical protein OIF38_02415, partial [Cellvibrionaceae bacterium]|nr:hypothetical protein [Cellvibrionaceae bacterium]